MNKKLISEAISEFIWHCRYEKCLNGKTIRAYEMDLKQFETLLRVKDISDIKKTHIQIWLEALNHYKHKTLKRKLATVKCFLAYYELENDWFNNPMRRMQIKIKEPCTLPVTMTLEDIRSIFNIVYQKSLNSQGQRRVLSIRDLAVLELLFATGIRVDELCKLTKDDIDLSSGFVKIHGKGKRDRVIAICQDATIAALSSWLKMRNSDNTFFFLNRLNHPITPQNIRQMLHKVSSEAKIKKLITPHTFRHTFATLLLEEDVDIRYIQQILGHSSIKTTEIYTHVSTKKQREILLNKHPRLKLTPCYL